MPPSIGASDPEIQVAPLCGSDSWSFLFDRSWVRLGPSVARALDTCSDQRAGIPGISRRQRGREKLRRRVGVEHRLAHISQRQGHRARYRGLRKNFFDLRRAAAVQNLGTIQREQLEQAA
jgi:hypothetical protein